VFDFADERMLCESFVLDEIFRFCRSRLTDWLFNDDLSAVGVAFCQMILNGEQVRI
jgi:hypothetical protein